METPSEKRIRRDELQAEIKKGIEQLDRGEFVVYDSPTAIKIHILARGRQKLGDRLNKGTKDAKRS